jgi:hypothetical protein
MKVSRIVPACLALVAVLALGAAANRPAPAMPGATSSVITVYKSPTCGCCQAWVDYLKANGFEVKTIDLDDLSEIKAMSGVPRPIQTCHTAVVAGYVIEGHVPADAIAKLLKEQPKIAGIGVAGMPVGSPGMEVPGTPAQHYDVMSWDKTGKTSVYAKK